MLFNFLVKKLIPTMLVLALVVCGGLWFYGFLGIKMGWIKVGDLNGMNPITRHGADIAGGVTGALGNSVKGIID